MWENLQVQVLTLACGTYAVCCLFPWRDGTVFSKVSDDDTRCAGSLTCLKVAWESVVAEYLPPCHHSGYFINVHHLIYKHRVMMCAHYEMLVKNIIYLQSTCQTLKILSLLCRYALPWKFPATQYYTVVWKIVLYVVMMINMSSHLSLAFPFSSINLPSWHHIRLSPACLVPLLPLSLCIQIVSYELVCPLL